MTDEVCGECYDMSPEKYPGQIVLVCTRKKHSTRAWHWTADEKTKWRTPKVKK